MSIVFVLSLPTRSSKRTENLFATLSLRYRKSMHGSIRCFVTTNDCPRNGRYTSSWLYTAIRYSSHAAADMSALVAVMAAATAVTAADGAAATAARAASIDRVSSGDVAGDVSGAAAGVISGAVSGAVGAASSALTTCRWRRR